MKKQPAIHLTRWGNILFNRSLLNIGVGANKAEKSTKLYGKFKHQNGHWVHWTKIELDALPDSHKKHFLKI